MGPSTDWIAHEAFLHVSSTESTYRYCISVFRDLARARQLNAKNVTTVLTDIADQTLAILERHQGSIPKGSRMNPTVKKKTVSNLKAFFKDDIAQIKRDYR